MVLPFGPGKKFRDVVVAEAFAQAERTRLGAVGLRCGWSQNGIKARSQRHVYHFLERLAEFGRPLSGLCRHVRVKRQCGSHTGIMMYHSMMSRSAGEFFPFVKYKGKRIEIGGEGYRKPSDGYDYAVATNSMNWSNPEDEGTPLTEQERSEILDLVRAEFARLGERANFS